MGAEMSGQKSLAKTTDDIADRWSGYYKYETGSGVKYAAVMEFGSKRHDITPNTEGALHFWVDGVEVITRYVDHPGTEPRPFMRPGAEGAARQGRAVASRSNDLQQFVEYLAEEVQRIARRLAPEKTGRLKASITVRRIA